MNSLKIIFSSILVLFSTTVFAIDNFEAIATDVPSSQIMSDLLSQYPNSITISARTGSLDAGGGIVSVLYTSNEGNFFEVLELGTYKKLMSAPTKLTFSAWRKNLALISRIDELCPLVFKIESSALASTDYDCLKL